MAEAALSASNDKQTTQAVHGKQSESSQISGKSSAGSSGYPTTADGSSSTKLAARMAEIQSPDYAGSAEKHEQGSGDTDTQNLGSADSVSDSGGGESTLSDSDEVSNVGHEMDAASIGKFSDSGPSETIASTTGQFSDSGPSDLPTSNEGSYSDSGPDTNPSSGSKKNGTGNYSDAGPMPDQKPQHSEDLGASSAMQRIAKPARFAARFTGALAVGAFDVAKGTLSARADKTIGNKLAVAIRNRRTALEGQAAGSSENENTLSAGTEEPVDRASEIAAFENRSTGASAPGEKVQNSKQQPK